MHTIVFTAYQHFFTAKGEEKSIAIERNALVSDLTDLNQVMGGIYQSLFNLNSLATFTKRKILSFSHPVFLRFTFNGEVVDTASFEKELLPAMKMTSKHDGRKKFAKNTWAMMIDHTTVLEPVTYVHEIQDIVPVRLLGTVHTVQPQIAGERFTSKPTPKRAPKKVKKDKKQAVIAAPMVATETV